MSNLDTFESSLQAMNLATAQMDAWKGKKREALGGLRKHVLATLDRYLELFTGLVDEDDLPVHPGRDPLDALYTEEGNLVAEFYYSTRGCDGMHKVELPERYVRTGGEALMVADAEALRAKKDQDAEAARVQEEADARATLAELQARFGAADAAQG